MRLTFNYETIGTNERIKMIESLKKEMKKNDYMCEVLKAGIATLKAEKKQDKKITKREMDKIVKNSPVNVEVYMDKSCSMLRFTPLNSDNYTDNTFYSYNDKQFKVFIQEFTVCDVLRNFEYKFKVLNDRKNEIYDTLEAIDNTDLLERYNNLMEELNNKLKEANKLKKILGREVL